jgi:hypothetical protein
LAYQFIRRRDHSLLHSIQAIIDEQDEAWTTGLDARRRKARKNTVRLCWVALALASLVLQATWEVNISPIHVQILNVGELVITIAFDIESIPVCVIASSACDLCACHLSCLL